MKQYEELVEDIQELIDQKNFRINEIKWIESRIKIIEIKIYNTCEHNWNSKDKCTKCDSFKK
jgi:hypothetical protein